jgi:hypothetical protein
MRSVLFHAFEPTASNRMWVHFRQQAQVTMVNDVGAERLSSAVWLIALPDTQMGVDRLVRVARKHGISFRLLEVEHAGDGPPQWLTDQ